MSKVNRKCKSQSKTWNQQHQNTESRWGRCSRGVRRNLTWQLTARLPPGPAGVSWGSRLPGVCKVCKVKAREELGKQKRVLEAILQWKKAEDGGVSRRDDQKDLRYSVWWCAPDSQETEARTEVNNSKAGVTIMEWARFGSPTDLCSKQTSG